MQIDILTIFPQQIDNFLAYGVFRIAQEKKKLKIQAHDLRKWSEDKHNTVDDRPYGGGAGMVMMVGPIDRALKDLRKTGTKVIITTPRGKRFDQSIAKEFASEPANGHLIIICGHYEGVDERVHEYLVDVEISVGDFILSGGEIAALLVSDAVTRLIPGVLGNENSIIEESFEENMLEYPQYTRPEEYKGWEVPKVLLSGDHSKIEEWRENRSKITTKEKRPDIIK